MIAVPLLTENSVIGLVEAFFYEAHAFNESDVCSLKFLSELILAAMRPDEERCLEQVAERVAERTSSAEQIPHEAYPEATTAAVDQGAQHQPRPRLRRFFTVNGTESASPGLRVVLAVVLVAVALGAGLWWHMHGRTASANTARTPQTMPASSVQAASLQDTDDPLTATDSILGTDPNKQKLAVLPQITGIRHWSTPEASTVVVDLQDQVQYEAHRLTNPERIYFDLHDTALASGLFGKNIDVGDALLTRVRIAQPMTGVTRVVLETKGGSNFAVSLEPDPYRLVVELRPMSAPTRVRQNIDLFSAPEKPASSDDVQTRGSAPKFRIVLDAGHGGWDLGTVGRDGLLEKDLVLDVVRRLGSLLDSRSRAEVIFTRKDDTYIPLDKRTETANQAQADMFVSIHANYSDSRSARGVETYYTNTFSSLNARSREGSASLQGVSFAKLDIRAKVEQSRRFAATLQRALYRALVANNPGLPNRGIKEASYVVLTGTAMPAVLAEISFVSSPADEEKLVNSAYRQQIAEALYKGISAYAEQLPSTKIATASAKSGGQ
jgi:N-acetylmuramoyl-L-alanine amidase